MGYMILSGFRSQCWNKSGNGNRMSFINLVQSRWTLGLKMPSFLHGTQYNCSTWLHHLVPELLEHCFWTQSMVLCSEEIKKSPKIKPLSRAKSTCCIHRHYFFDPEMALWRFHKSGVTFCGSLVQSDMIDLMLNDEFVIALNLVTAKHIKSIPFRGSKNDMVFAPKQSSIPLLNRTWNLCLVQKLCKLPSLLR